MELTEFPKHVGGLEKTSNQRKRKTSTYLIDELKNWKEKKVNFYI